MWFDWQHIKGDGEVFTAHIALNHFYFNKEAHYHAIVRDITDQKKFEHNLLESEDKFKKIFEFNPAAIALSTFNHHFRCLDINQGFEKLLQIPKEKIIGRTITELGYSIPPDLYAELRSRLKKDGYFQNVNVPVELPNKTTIHCIISGIIVNIMQEPMVMTITVDITEQKQIEAKLKQYQNYLEDIVNERTEKIRQLNEELSTTNENLVQSNEELFQQKEEMASTLEELRNTQSQLFQSEKMASLGVLTAGIAHEINNPINFISSGVYGLQVIIQALIDYIRNNEQYQISLRENIPEANKDNSESIDNIIAGADKLFDNIQLGVDRANSIIQSLKTFSFKGTGAKELMNIHKGLEATLVMLNHLIKGRIEIIKNFAEIPMVYCQSSQINQVFMNIIYNAIDSIKEKGTITINTSVDIPKDRVIISITDTGSGIPEEIKKRIFEPFYTTKDVGKGTGLGLSISYSIIKELQGELYFTSQMGQGTTFYIELPIKGA
jgi:PAS domain S-box-containing protein